MNIVGKNIPHDSAITHVTGSSEFVSDIPKLNNEVLVDFFQSTEAHAEILNIDLSQAREIEGIIGLYTYKDITGVNKLGPINQDEVLLAENKVEYYGQPIVIIAGETIESINKAKKAIKVSYKPIKHILSIEEAIKEESYLLTEQVIQNGDIEKGFFEAENILEFSVNIPGQEHFYLETQSAVVYPLENNSYKVISATQNPSYVQSSIAEILGVPYSQVIVETKRMGGAFGGKENQSAHPAAMAAIVASKRNKAARIKLSVDDDMQTTGKRHAFLNKYKVAFSNNGLITTLSAELFSNGGYANDVSTSVMERALLNAENAYYVPNFKAVGKICKTNLPPNTAFRGFGAPQGVLGIEQVIENIALFLKKDPLEIRLLNLYRSDKNNITPYGQAVENNTLGLIIKKIAESSNYYEKANQINNHNKSNNATLRGISCIPIKYGVAFTAKFLNQASALVNIYTDGSIQVSTGATEMGQGVNTKIKQIVAEEFCINPELVKIMTTSTEKNNNTSPTAGSTGADLNGSAALEACKKIKKSLMRFASEALFPEKPDIKDIVWSYEGIWHSTYPENIISYNDLIKTAYFNRISLGERGFFITPTVDFDKNTGQGRAFLYYTNGAAVSEIEIDRFTGDVKVKRTDILMDIGNSINPGIDRGQIAGAFVQGMGWLTMEELKYSDNGQLLTHSPTTYKIPGINDIPEIFNIDWIENDTNTLNIKKSKGIGEPPFLFGISVFMAIQNALASISGEESVQLNAPASAEKVLSKISGCIIIV